MSDPTQKVSLDPRRRSVNVGDRTTVLQEKAWGVLQLLIERAPQDVTRSAFIDVLWAGNHPVGDRGLNQALWTIRIALGDDARQPTFIRTLPRVGYRWIGPPAVVIDERRTPAPRRLALAASLAASVAGLAATFLLRTGVTIPATDALSAPVSIADDGTRAYLDARRIVVDMPEGCQRVVVADDDEVRFDRPLVSADGRHIVFQVHRAKECKLVSLELRSGDRQDYGRCPAWRT